jgi:hypothetical protein
MAERLDMRQRNNLATGNTLAAELAPTGPGRRAFVIVWPFHESLRLPGAEPAQALAGLA